MEIKINIAKDFSNAPAGRFASDGEFSGENFRNRFITPYINNPNVSLIIFDLAGLDGVAGSFWREAFKDIGSNKAKIKILCDLEVLIWFLILILGIY